MPRFLQLTDTHIYADATGRFDGLDTRASLAAVLRAALEEGPVDAVLLTGDLAMDGSAGAYAHLDAVLPAQPKPIAIPGNHDEPAVIAHAAPRLALTLPCALDYGAWRLLCFDTRIAGAPQGALGDYQIAWLRQQLSIAHAGYTALIMHHPPVSVGSPWMDAMGLTDAPALWTLLATSRAVGVIVCGHVHQTVDCRLHGVRVLASPSTCVQFAPRAVRYQTDARLPGYRVLSLADDGGIETYVARVPL